MCPPELYKEAAQKHLSKDELVEWKILPDTEKLLNRTSVNVIKIFNIGDDGSDSQKDRINKAGITKDAAPPPVSFLWKTHKIYERLPPTRPVCDVSSGPLSRPASFLCMILTPIMRRRQCPEYCDSTEDMLHTIEEANR